MTEHRPADDIEEEKELRPFMATLAHDLLTPLAAVYGEVDLALRRDRTADSYRDTLSRIRLGLAELLDLSADLALIAEDEPGQPGVVRVDAMLAAVALRYPEVSIQVQRGTRLVVGEQTRLGRALGLVIEHLRKCDPSGHPVTVADAPGDAAATSAFRLILRSGPAGAVRRGTFRLRAAAHVLRTFGGVLKVLDTQPGTAVEIRLQIPSPDVHGVLPDAK